MIIKNHFHKKGFALGLVLKQRLAASRKWPIWRGFFENPYLGTFSFNLANLRGGGTFFQLGS